MRWRSYVLRTSNAVQARRVISKTNPERCRPTVPNQTFEPSLSVKTCRVTKRAEVDNVMLNAPVNRRNNTTTGVDAETPRKRYVNNTMEMPSNCQTWQTFRNE